MRRMLFPASSYNFFAASGIMSHGEICVHFGVTCPTDSGLEAAFWRRPGLKTFSRLQFLRYCVVRGTETRSGGGFEKLCRKPGGEAPNGKLRIDGDLSFQVRWRQIPVPPSRNSAGPRYRNWPHWRGAKGGHSDRATWLHTGPRFPPTWHFPALGAVNRQKSEAAKDSHEKPIMGGILSPRRHRSEHPRLMARGKRLRTLGQMARRGDCQSASTSALRRC